MKNLAWGIIFGAVVKSLGQALDTADQYRPTGMDGEHPYWGARAVEGQLWGSSWPWHDKQLATLVRGIPASVLLGIVPPMAAECAELLFNFRASCRELGLSLGQTESRIDEAKSLARTTRASFPEALEHVLRQVLTA